MDDIDRLNARHALPGSLRFERGPGGLPFAVAGNDLLQGRVCLHGAHIVHYQPRGGAHVLWLSKTSRYAPGQAIRGGIPVCWPWFAAHPSDPAKPAHGFARTSFWRVVRTSMNPDGGILITLALEPTAATRALWPHNFHLELHIWLGVWLSLSLDIHNNGDTPFVCGGALHSYFQVGDWRQVRIHGLAGLEYLDKTEGFRQKTQHGPVTLEQETDRIYLGSGEDCVIEDPVLGRRLKIGKRGSRTTVVWNPGPLKAAAMKDMELNGHQTMVCVESVLAGGADCVTLPPGARHQLRQDVEILPAGS